MNSSTDIESVPFTDVVIDNTPDRAARRLAQCMYDAVQAVLYRDEPVVIERLQPARGREGIDLVISAGGTLRRAMFSIDAPMHEAVPAFVRAALDSREPIDGPKMLDRVVARAKATGGAASVTADELEQLRREVRNAGGDLYPVAGLGPSRYSVPLPDPTGAGNGGTIEIVLDSDSPATRR